MHDYRKYITYTRNTMTLFSCYNNICTTKDSATSNKCTCIGFQKIYRFHNNEVLTILFKPNNYSLFKYSTQRKSLCRLEKHVIVTNYLRIG